MLFMSKQRSEPSSDCRSAFFTRARRCSRRRSMLTRSSQSTPMRPNFFRSIIVFSRKNSVGAVREPPLQFSAESLRRLGYALRRRHRLVFENRRERHRHVHRAYALYRRVEVIKRPVGDDRRDLGGDALTLVALVDPARARPLLPRGGQRLFVSRHRLS